jgi:hypothetical protein
MQGWQGMPWIWRSNALCRIGTTVSRVFALSALGVAYRDNERQGYATRRTAFLGSEKAARYLFIFMTSAGCISHSVSCLDNYRVLGNFAEINGPGYSA